MKKVVLIWYFCVVALAGSFAQNGSYKDPNLSPEERAEEDD